MELFGIVLSIPVAFVVSMLYCLFLARIVLRFEKPSQWLRGASYFVLTMFAVEVALLVTLGATRGRDILGRIFYEAHLGLFFFSTPALANVLVLRSRRRFFTQWYVAGAICTLFAFVLVLLQYSVSEVLFGIE